MRDEEEAIGRIMDRSKFPTHFPTHKHPAEFWENLGRCVATYGFLEEFLGRAIFALTATRTYEDHEVQSALSAWRLVLERALTDALWQLAESFAKAAR